MLLYTEFSIWRVAAYCFAYAYRLHTGPPASCIHAYTEPPFAEFDENAMLWQDKGVCKTWFLREEKCIMEPDWKAAPHWARWFTIDKDGAAWWWDTQPATNKTSGCWRIAAENYQRYLAGKYPPSDHWRRSLIQRTEAVKQLCLFTERKNA